jgi:hypothetical protein
MHGREKRNAYKILVLKLEGKKPLRKPRRRRENNIKIDVKQNGVVWNGFIWLGIGYSGELL